MNPNDEILKQFNPEIFETLQTARLDILAYECITQMEDFHGHFINQIFKAWRLADPENRREMKPLMCRLLEKYPELIVMANNKMGEQLDR